MPKSLPVLDLRTSVPGAPVGAGVISDTDALDVAMRLKALADPVRVKIVSLVLAAEPEGLRNVDLVGKLGLADSTVSHHLGQLHRAGFLTRSSVGTSRFYRADYDALAAIVRVVDPSCC